MSLDETVSTADHEGYYASVFYPYFAALGYEITVEESSSQGRLGHGGAHRRHVYLFAFEVADG